MLLIAAAAHAQSDVTRDALDRLEEVLELRIDEGLLSSEAVVPAILVSAQPRYEGSEAWFTTRAIEVLAKAFGAEGLRMCEACAVPRAFVEDGSLTYQAGPLSLDEVARLDDASRGEASPARSAIWLDEHRGGVSIRVVDIATGRVLFAQNVDPALVEYQNTERIYTLSAELERRARGGSLTQAFVDVALYPDQHVSLDWTDQWGRTNANLTGLSVSVLDPVAGIGAAHYRRVDFLNILVGAKGLVSIPTAVARSLGDNSGGNVVDPLVTGVGVIRLPLGRSNFGAVFTASTNGKFGIGISLLNISLLPVLP